MKPNPNEIIWRDGVMKLSLSPFVSDAWLDYVGTVWFGQPGQHYQRRAIRQQVARFEQPRFLTLTYAGKLVGSYLLDLQALHNGQENVLGVYRGLLSIDKAFRTQGLGAQIVDATLRWIDQHAEERGQPLMTYGCIDSHNAHSLNLLHSRGMQTLGTLRHLMIYRQLKRHRLSPPLISDTLTDDALTKLTDQRSSNTLSPQHLAFGNWATVSENGGPTIACRHAINELSLAPMSGLKGFVVERLMPWFPPGHRRFNPRRFRYVSLSDPLYHPGSEPLWRRLIEHLMVVHDCHFVNVTLNEGHAPHQRMLDSGIFSKAAIRSASQLQVIGRGDDRALPPGVTTLLAARDL